MRVLIATQYFQPERTAAALRLAPLAFGLGARGHEVDVVCEAPSHPEGLVHPGYGRKLVDRRSVEGATVHYVRTYTHPSKAASRRLLSYASYALAGALEGSRGGHPDVVFASSPPLSVGAVGWAIAKRHRVPWVLDVRDLWPAAAEALGAIKKGRALRAAERLERGLYASAAAVTTTTDPFRAHIEARGGTGKTHIVPNGTTDDWLGLADQDVDRQSLDLPSDTFLWTYAGNIGLSYDLETAIQAARELGDGFTLLLLGDGPAKERLKQAAAASRGHVVFRDAVAPPTAARFMRASDALLVSAPLLGAVAVKLYDSCAVGRPAVVVGPGETARVAEQAGAGVIVPPDSPHDLAGAVRNLSDDSALRSRVIEGGLKFARAHRRNDQVPVLEQILADAVAHGR